LAARLLTGPIAFFLAGCIDLSLFLIVVLRQWLGRCMKAR
jgi:hypothetical protein